MESKISRKDADFMILLSTYLLNEDYSTIRDKMTKLAEQGQINAIQYFYLMKNEFEINQKIDRNLKNAIKVGGFECDIAIKNYLLAKTNTDFYFPETYNGIAEIEAEEIAQIEKDCFKKLKNQLEQNSSPILFERYAELKVLFGKKLTQTDKQNLKKTQNKLLNAYKENNKNIEVAFALGKNLLLFSEDDSHKILGKQILSEISKKELSKQLEDYSSTQTRFLKAPKQNIVNSKTKTQKKETEKRQDKANTK